MFIFKGGLISKKKFHFGLKSSKMGAKSRPWAQRKDAEGHDLALIFGDLSQSEKPSKIKPLLLNTFF